MSNCCSATRDRKVTVVTGAFTLIDRILASINQPVANGGIRVNPAVAQERPVAANIFQSLQIDISHQDFFTIVRGFGQHAPERIAEKRSAPEFQSLAGG